MGIKWCGHWSLTLHYNLVLQMQGIYITSTEQDISIIRFTFSLLVEEASLSSLEVRVEVDHHSED